MRTIIILLSAIALHSAAFINMKCDHVFTQVEQATIKIERQNIFQGGYYTIPEWPTGLQEGKEMICVKCFYKQRQVLDYGQPVPSSPSLTDSMRLDRVLKLGSSGLRFVKFDSISLK